MRKRKIIIIVCLLLILATEMILSGCTNSGSNSSSSKVYTCGYCGKEMKGGYYDYINGKYACRSCSKERRK